MKRINIFGNCPNCRHSIVKQYKNENDRYFLKAIPIMDMGGKVEYLCKNCKYPVEINPSIIKSIKKFRHAIKTTKIHPQK